MFRVPALTTVNRLLEPLRQRIERQVFRVNGLSLNEFDLTQPPGDAGLFGPESVVWRVHGDFPSMLCGGISALLLQMLHPAALAGVWDHSNFRADMLGRLRRTSQFIAVTTFGNQADANTLIERVKNIHLRVSGVDNYQQPYAASDPALLTWVHVAETSSFLAAHLRYRNPQLSLREQDDYYTEAARIAQALGAESLPTSVAETQRYLEQMRPALRFDARTAEVTRLLWQAPAPHWMAYPVMRTMLYGGTGLLPLWAQQMSGAELPRWRQQFTDSQIHLVARLLRWSVRRGAWHRARARMGYPP